MVCPKSEALRNLHLEQDMSRTDVIENKNTDMNMEGLVKKTKGLVTLKRKGW